MNPLSETYESATAYADDGSITPRSESGKQPYSPRHDAFHVFRRRCSRKTIQPHAEDGGEIPLEQHLRRGHHWERRNEHNRTSATFRGQVILLPTVKDTSFLFLGSSFHATMNFTLGRMIESCLFQGQ